GIDTMFLATSLEYSFLSSTIVKELAYYGSDISRLVPDKVEEMMKKKTGNLKDTQNKYII
ncbi:MAG: pantetheine-phosphate adenylyltransferase, partial [Lachnospiraceae bacterium]|nr:pantetheine-phosphate adenylyltransferase [Lachnospiraceae bacterium]